MLSEGQFTFLWLALTALSAVAIVRWLRLPLWWRHFPPAVEDLFSGSPQLVVLMLLLAGAGRAGVVADSIAVALKVYAMVPLLGERQLRRIGLALALTVVTVAVAPTLWIHYAQEFRAISARLALESQNGFSAFHDRICSSRPPRDPGPLATRREGGRMARGSGALAVERVPLLDVRAAGHDTAPGGPARGPDPGTPGGGGRARRLLGARRRSDQATPRHLGGRGDAGGRRPARLAPDRPRP